MQRDEDAFPGVGQAIWLVVAVWMAELLCVAVLDALGLFGRDERMQSWIIATVVGNGLVTASFLTRHSLTYRNVVHPSRQSARAVVGLLWLPLLMVLPAVYLVAGAVDQVLVDIVPMPEWQRRMFAELVNSGPASAVGLVLVAPVVEELLFRGIILRGLLSRQRPWVAIATSSVIFGAAHLNLYQFVGAGLIGLLLGWLYLRFRSSVPCILLHSAYNATVLGFAGMADATAEARFFDQVPAVAWVAGLVCGLLGSVMLLYLARRSREPETIRG